MKSVEDPNKYVINLTKKPFTKNQFKLLNKNLNFVPNPGKPNQKDFNNDTNKYFRRIILKGHFGNEEPPKSEGYITKRNPDWTPHKIHHFIQTYIQAVNNDLNTGNTNPGNKTKPNLNKDEAEALDELKNRDDIIISKADKNRGVVIQNTEDYIAEANRQLSNRTFYEEKDEHLTQHHSSLVNKTIDSFLSEDLTSEKAAKALKNENPKTAKFYTLPKVHKTGNPGRPIITALNTATTNICSPSQNLSPAT